MIAVEIAQLLNSIDSAAFDYEPESSAGNVFIGHMPDQPDDAVMVIDQPGPTADVKLGYDEPGFQVIVRAGDDDPRPAHDKALRIYNELHGLHDVALPDGTWLVKCIGIQSHPVSLARDANNRYEYSLNFQTEVRSLTRNRE